MTKFIFATNIHGSDGCWSRFLNAENFSEAGLFAPRGSVTGEAAYPIAPQGRKDYRITLLEQVFDVPGSVNFQPMLTMLSSVPGTASWAQ